MIIMTEEEKIRRLENNERDKYVPQTARAYIKARGKCRYCDEDLFQTENGFWSGQIDHLLPHSKYKHIEKYEELERDPRNNIYCCVRCNQKKSGMDPLADFEMKELSTDNPLDFTDSDYEKITSYVRKRVIDERKGDKEEFEKIKTIVRG